LVYATIYLNLIENIKIQNIRFMEIILKKKKDSWKLFLIVLLESSFLF